MLKVFCCPYKYYNSQFTTSTVNKEPLYYYFLHNLVETNRKSYLLPICLLCVQVRWQSTRVLWNRSLYLTATSHDHKKLNLFGEISQPNPSQLLICHNIDGEDIPWDDKWHMKTSITPKIGCDRYYTFKRNWVMGWKRGVYFCSGKHELECCAMLLCWNW